MRLGRHVKELSVGLPTEDLGQIVFTDKIVFHHSVNSVKKCGNNLELKGQTKRNV